MAEQVAFGRGLTDLFTRQSSQLSGTLCSTSATTRITRNWWPLMYSVDTNCIYYSLGVPSPLCILELSRQIHIECQSKHSYIYVIYKVLVYVQTSQPTTCSGLFQLDHLQVGHKGQRNYTIMQYYN